MTSALDPRAIEYATWLAGLPAPERQRATDQVRMMALAQLPDTEIEAAPIRTLGQYLDEPIELPPMLVEPGIAAVGALTAMTARGGKGKTAVSLNRIVKWAMGKPLFDELPEVLAPVRPLKTLIIENEGAAGHFQFVIQTILEKNGFTDAEKSLARENVLIWGDGGWSALKLDQEENLLKVERGLAQWKPDLVFIEPMRGLWRGDENSSTEMHILMDNLAGLANRYEAGILLTHHERKSGAGDDGEEMSAARGSGVLEGHAAVMERWKPAAAGKQRELSYTKSRFKEPPAPIRMRFDRESWSYEYVEEDENARRTKQALQSVGEWASLGDISAETGESKDTERRRLNNLVDDGVATRRSVPGEGHVWRLKGTDDGADSGALAIT